MAHFYVLISYILFHVVEHTGKRQQQMGSRCCLCYSCLVPCSLTSPSVLFVSLFLLSLY